MIAFSYQPAAPANGACNVPAASPRKKAGEIVRSRSRTGSDGIDTLIRVMTAAH
jgi:hypothetical protein